jgi:hypothetical protein
MHLTRRHLDFERRPVGVDEEVEFAAESASGTAEGVIFGLLGMALDTFFDAPADDLVARMDVPSMHHRFQSIFPSRSSRRWRASRIASSTPPARHLLK